MRNYIGLDGNEYATIAALTEANRKVKEHPLYLKEMKRRAIANIPGSITREEWHAIKKIEEQKQEKFEEVLDKWEKEKSDREEVIVNPKSTAEKKSTDVDKKKYSFNISQKHKSLVRSANARGMEFDLSSDQIDSLLEKKCYFCRTDSETLITVDKRFDYTSARPVCGTCKKVYDVLGDEMQEYIDRLVQD
jgi:2-oxoglutarate dehydrogenase complex dehydrogenase (E1) component-like enzyme